MVFSLIPSSKGEDLLATDGFMFAQKARLADGSIRRERTLRRSKNCPCTAHTDAARAEVTTKGARNHPGDVAKVTAAAARVAMAARAKDGGGRPARIVSEAMSAIPEDVKTEMGHIDSLKRWIRKVSKGRAPAEPGSAAALSFPGNYVRALDGQGRLFLQYDNGPESVGATEGRVVVFATDKMLRVLGESEWWFGDGNFKMAPAIFAQLYVFRPIRRHMCLRPADSEGRESI